jgi:hypothetical protein
MNIWIILVIVAMIVAIVFLSHNSSDEKKVRKHYIEQMASFLEAPWEAPETDIDTYRIRFKYGQRDFIFEDIEDRTLVSESFREGVLKTKTSSPLTVSFLEKSRGKIRTDIKSIKDLKYGWAQLSSDIVLPQGMEDLSVFTNNPTMTKELLADDKIVNFFKSFKSRGSRGHPVMSLEIKDGEVILKFHAPGQDLKPNLYDLQLNATLIENYVKDLSVLAGKIDSLQTETELSGR